MLAIAPSPQPSKRILRSSRCWLHNLKATPATAVQVPSPSHGGHTVLAPGPARPARQGLVTVGSVHFIAATPGGTFWMRSEGTRSF